MRPSSSIIAKVFVVPALMLAGPQAAGQLSEPLPGDLEEVGVTQNLDAQLPLDLTFTDATGRSVALDRFFDGERPVLLTLVYYECPMLCTLVLDGLVDTLQQLDWLPGREFEIVTVSIDPTEATPLARLKKQNYVEAYGRPTAAQGWHFLTGDPAAIRHLTSTVGFRYTYVEETGEYAHPAVLFLLTPDGRVSRYLFGVRHDPRTVRLSLVEAAEGKIGSPVDKFLLYCYRYDSSRGRYAPAAFRLMQVGAALMVVILGAALVTLWRREARHKRLA